MIPAILISGWAHPAQVLDPLAGELGVNFDALCLSTSELTHRPIRPGQQVVCIHGAADRVVPCDASRVLAERRSGVLEVLAESGHSVPVTSPCRVADAIRRSLRACVSPQPWNR